MTLLIFITPLAIALIILTLSFLPDIKPFNCLPCLTFWLTVTYICIFDIDLIFYSPIGYLIGVSANKLRL